MVWVKGKGIGKKMCNEKDIKRLIKKQCILTGEKKHTITELNTTSNDAPTFLQLNVVANGTTDVTRIGDSIRPLGLSFGYNLANGDATNVMRVVIFQWNDATAPTGGGVFESTTTYAALTGGFCRDSLNSKKLRIIYDKVIALNAVSSPNHAEKHYKSLKGIRTMNYLAGSSSSGNNNLYVCYMSDSSAVAHPAFQFCSILDFVDN